MKNKHLGASVFEDIKRWEKADPSFRKAVDEYKEKAMLGMVLREVRRNENITQAQLAKKSKRSAIKIQKDTFCNLL